MPIANYSVLAGSPVAGKVVTAGTRTHYQIRINAPGGPFLAVVNIKSMDGSQVLYAIREDFTPPDEAGLLALPMGMMPLESAPGGLALDYVRSESGGRPMIRKQEMTLLPLAGAKGVSDEERMLHQARAAALQNAVVTLLNMTIADKQGVMYGFGSAFPNDGRPTGIHDIHMNQGNPEDGHSKENGVWQDGALLIHLPSKGTWTAVFIAFQTESWKTDSAGVPV